MSLIGDVCIFKDAYRGQRYIFKPSLRYDVMLGERLSTFGEVTPVSPSDFISLEKLMVELKFMHLVNFETDIEEISLNGGSTKFCSFFPNLRSKKSELLLLLKGKLKGSVPIDKFNEIEIGNERYQFSFVESQNGFPQKNNPKNHIINLRRLPEFPDLYGTFTIFRSNQAIGLFELSL